MSDYKDIATRIQEAKDLSLFIDIRATQLHNSQNIGDKREWTIVSYDLNGNCSQVHVKLKEDTRHDSPDYLYIELDLSLLDMPEGDWEKYIHKETEKNKVIADAIKEEESKKAYARAKEQIDYLKNKFNIS